MKRSYIGIVFLWTLLSTLPIYAQEDEKKDGEKEKEEKLDKDVEEAYEAFEARQYYFAIELLKEAFTEVRGRDDKTDVTYKIAESYRFTNQYEMAQRYYERAIKLGYEDPEAIYLKGQMLKAQKKYEDAIVAFQDYKEDGGNETDAEKAIASTREAIRMQDEPSMYQVYPMEDINSDAWDMSVIYGGKMRENDVLIFESTREEAEGNDEDGWIGESFTDLFTTTAERKSRRRRSRRDQADDIPSSELRWSTPVPIDEEEIVNTEYHDGAPAFGPRRKDLYFTRCEVEKNKKMDCAIYVTSEVGQSWREPERVYVVTDSFANMGQPAIGLEGERLYFVSTDFDSKGGRDIFMTTFNRRTDTWRKPTNLGDLVNTEGDEYYPVVNQDGYLYFSTNGIPGMGGLDIYKVKLGKDGLPTGEREHLKYPLNSSNDDYHLIFEDEANKKGYLSSNREGSNGDDIYAVFKTPLKYTLEGVVTDAQTGAPLPLTVVKLDGSDGTSVISNTDKDGYYTFGMDKLSDDVNYKLTFEKKKYLNATSDATTVGVELSQFNYVPSDNHFVHTITVNKELDPIEEPIVLPNVFFDLAKWDLRPEAMQALDSVVDIMNNNPRVVLELRSHTDYRGSNQSNVELSQKRADTCVKYLISKGVNPKRLVPRGMGESEPFKIPENYDGYGSDLFNAGTVLSESYIKGLDQPNKKEVANQINRRTDIKVLRDDFIPEGGLKDDKSQAVNPEDVLDKKEAEADKPGKIYIVKGRESFGRIARKFDINIVELKRLNGGLRGVRPFDGLQLKVEPDGNYDRWDATHYQVQRRGADLKDVAKKLEIDKDKLEELNPKVEDDMIQPGFWLRTKR